MQSCVFCDIKTGKIPKEFTYVTDEVMVFPDLHPQAKVHLLIVPKQHISEYLLLTDARLGTLLRETIQKMIQDFGIEKKGYRVVINGGGAQIVNHLHIHLLGYVKKG